MQRREARPLCVVLVRDRRTEERHDAVARELVDGTLEAMDAGGENLEEAIDDRAPALGIELLGQLHRALHIGEEDGHLLPLALESGTGGEDLLGEMPRRVRVGVAGRRRRSGGKLTTLGAERGARRERSAAGGTGTS